MPTYRALPRFMREYDRLSAAQQAAFNAVVVKFVADLKRGSFRRGLRVKGVAGHPGIYEMTWAPDGRATFEYGDPVQPGERHIIWRRIGSHDVLDEP